MFYTLDPGDGTEHGRLNCCFLEDKGLGSLGHVLFHGQHSTVGAFVSVLIQHLPGVQPPRWHPEHKVRGWECSRMGDVGAGRGEAGRGTGEGSR